MVQSGLNWSTSAVLVKKKDGSNTFCIDFRRVNAVTEKDSHPITQTDDELGEIGFLQHRI